MSKRITNLLLLVVSLTILDSCTKLTEKVLDETSAAGLTEKQIADGFIAPTYAKLEDIFMHTNYFALQEISTVAVPTGVITGSICSCTNMKM
jgi:hypothetical protein